MFKVDEKVVNSNGITCVIDRIERMRIPYSKVRKDYYIMHDLIHTGDVFYVPTDTDKSMRYPMSTDEAKSLINSIEEIDTLKIPVERFRDEEYRKCIKECSPERLVSLLKFFIERKNRLLSLGKNLSSMDEKYMRLASRNLFCELACSLSLPVDEVENLVIAKIH